MSFASGRCSLSVLQCAAVCRIYRALLQKRPIIFPSMIGGVQPIVIASVKLFADCRWFTSWDCIFQRQKTWVIHVTCHFHKSSVIHFKSASGSPTTFTAPKWWVMYPCDIWWVMYESCITWIHAWWVGSATTVTAPQRVTHSYKRRDSSIYAAWLIDMSAVTHVHPREEEIGN